MTHWLAVTVPENWELCVKTGLWGTTDRYASLMKRAAKDDLILFYVTGVKCAGIFRVIEPYFNNQERVWSDDLYPHRLRFEAVKGLVPSAPVDIRQFFSSFFPSISAGGYFRTAFRELPENEFGLFSNFLSEGYVQTLESSGEPLATESAAAFSLSIERDLEGFLEANIGILENGLRLYRDKEVQGRQFTTDVSRIDLLATDTENRFVVLELKAGEADRTVLGQILPYMGWVREHLAKGGTVRGMVVASEFAPELVAAMNVVANLSLYKYAVTFSLNRVAPAMPVTK